MVKNIGQAMCIIALSAIALINIRLYEVCGSHNMFDNVQCEAIQNELLIWKEH